MKKILYIDACIRDESRTRELADYLVSKLHGEVTRLELSKLNLKPLTKEELDLRTKLLEKGDYSHPMFDEAKRFKDADLIVLATPYYDFSFSSLVKVYIEHINCNGITFGFTEKGEYIKHCKANTLFYITTSGGELLADYGFNYIKALNEVFYGIKNTHLIAAENLDIVGVDVSYQVNEAKLDIDFMLENI